MPQYNGQIVELPLGENGLRTDDPNSALQAGHLIRAKNVTFQNGAVEKAPGSMRWNSSALGTGIRAGFDWWPDDAIQRMIVLGNNGKVYRYTDPLSQTEVVPTAGAPSALNTSQYGNIVAGGAEQGTNPRKLFIMTGYDPIQFISGDGKTRSNIPNPVGDFTGTNQPLDGVIFRGKLFVFLRNGHSVYASLTLDHGDFASQPLPYTIFPGESERIAGLFTFRSKLFCLKYPRGLYVMNDGDADPSQWYFERINGSFGAPGARCNVPVFDDEYIANEYGGVMSLTATNATGDVKAADIFAQLRVQKFVRDFLLPEGRGIRQGIYYGDKKTAIYIYQGRSSTQNDWLLSVDFSNTASPKVCWGDKDQPNCIFLRKDVTGIERPFYGANDGYLYSMDSPNLWVGTSDGLTQSGYTYEWQTPHFDLGNGNPAFGDSNKNWDFLELMYEPCGKFNISIDIYLDGRFHKTVQIELGGRSDLDSMHLDTDTTEAEVELTSMVPIQGLGKRISFRGYNSVAGQNCKITKLRVYYKMSGQQDRK